MDGWMDGYWQNSRLTENLLVRSREIRKEGRKKGLFTSVIKISLLSLSLSLFIFSRIPIT